MGSDACMGLGSGNGLQAAGDGRYGRQQAGDDGGLQAGRQFAISGIRYGYSYEGLAICRTNICRQRFWMKICGQMFKDKYLRTKIQRKISG